MKLTILKDPDNIITDVADLVDNFNQSCESSSEIYDYDASMKIITNATEVIVQAEFAVTEIWIDSAKYDYLDSFNCEAVLKFSGDTFKINGKSYINYTEWFNQVQKFMGEIINCPSSFNPSEAARIDHDDLAFRAVYEG
jgi:hypothetical protein